MSEIASCISYPANDEFAQIRRSLIAICDSHTSPNCAAILLHRMILLTDARLMNNTSTEAANENARRKGLPEEEVNLWIAVKVKTWVDYAFKEYSRDSVMSALTFLIEANMIIREEGERERNDDGSFTGHAHRYMLNSEAVQRRLNDLPPLLTFTQSRKIDSGKKASPESENRLRSSTPPESKNRLHSRYTALDITTRSSAISEGDEDTNTGGQPAPANDAGAADPQTPQSRKTLLKPAAMPTIPRATSSNFVKKDEGQGRGKGIGGDTTTPLAGPRPIVLALETKLGKMIPDVERKNLEAKRKLAWMGHEANGESPADLYDRDPRFAIYMDWMVDQAIAADLGAIKTLVGMLRNHNRGSKDAPGKIIGWWMWELQHPPVGSEAATVDPDAIDFNGQWVYDRKAIPPRPDLYVWAWDEVMQDGRKVARWYKAGNVETNG